MNLFKIHRHERIPALLALIFIVLLNALNVLMFYDKFSVMAENYKDVFYGKYIISGFDVISYITLSRWDVIYEVTRHPLMAFFMYIPSTLNEVLMAMTGVNCATMIAAVIWSLCALYAFIFLFRILHEIEELSIKMSCLLCALFYGFGYTMLSTFVPDHFGVSTMLLLMTVYFVGKKTKEGSEIKLWQTIVLFIMTAGVTLSNGIKVFLAAWTNKGRSFFKLKYLVSAVVLPAVLLFAFAQLEQYIFVQPRIDAANHKKAAADKAWRASVYKAYCDTAETLDSASVDSAVKAIVRKAILDKYHHDHLQPWNQHKGKALSKNGYMSWTDISTPRLTSLVENVFGEPLQMHEDYLLQDVLRSRPVLVNYNHWYNYMTESLLLLLMVIGIWVGRHRKIVWMVLSFFAFDMLIHLGLGFGLNEVYIMSPHYLFVAPIVIAPLLTSNIKFVKGTTILATSVLTAWFFWWNMTLLLPFLTTKIQ